MAEMEGLEAEDRETLERGIRAFNSGDFYEAHDHFEALWGEDVWKGFVQAAVALHHHSVENPAGVKGLPENVHRILDAYRPFYVGLDIERFLKEFDAFFEAVRRGEDPDIANAPKIRTLDDSAETDRPDREPDRHGPE